jgi:hypothetical protein
MKKLFLLAGFVVLPLATVSVAYALPENTTQPSDYSQDVSAGQKELANDQSAKNKANEVNKDENTLAEVDDVEETVTETVGSQEDNMGQDVSGESVHGDASMTESSNSEMKSSSSTESNDKNNTSSDMSGESNSTKSDSSNSTEGSN